jgi:hypothetical protein
MVLVASPYTLRLWSDLHDALESLQWNVSEGAYSLHSDGSPQLSDDGPSVLRIRALTTRLKTQMKVDQTGTPRRPG